MFSSSGLSIYETAATLLNIQIDSTTNANKISAYAYVSLTTRIISQSKNCNEKAIKHKKTFWEKGPLIFVGI
jgi:hypothetical protein